MSRTRPLFVGALAGLTLLALTLSAGAQAPAAGQAPPADQPIYLRVQVPDGAKVEIDGARTTQTGAMRRFVSPPVAAGKSYVYSLRVTWTGADGKEQKVERTVTVKPGQETTVDLRPAGAAPATPAAATVKKERPKLDIHYVPTPQVVVDKMLEMAKVSNKDVVYDLGCGDGRIVVTAAKKFGAKGIGVDLDPERVKDSLENVKKNNVGNLVEIREGNVFNVDVSPASVVTLYLYPDINLKLRPTLLSKLKPGSRVVSHDFDMGDWKAEQTHRMTDNDGTEHTIYLWTIPGKEEPKKAEPKKAEPKKAAAVVIPEPVVVAAAPAQEPKLTVPYVPTPQDVVEKMLELAKVTKDDVVYDLGCGDGRIVVTAAKKFGAKGVGVDLDPQRVKESKENAKKANVEKLVEFRVADVLKTDVSPASVVTLYLLPEVNLQLRPILLEKLKPGSRVVSHDFKMGDWKPLKEIHVTDKDGGNHDLYLWEIPKKK